MSSENKKYDKGGHVSKYETTSMQEINASPFIKEAFEKVRCLGFCEKIQKVGCHSKLTSIFSTLFKRNKTTRVGMEFLVSAEVIDIIFRVGGHLLHIGIVLHEKSVSEVMKKNFTKVKEVFFNHRTKNKKFVPFMHRFYYLREIPKI